MTDTIDMPMLVTFTQPTNRISMNDRLHWRPKANLTKAWRTAAFYAATAQLGRTPSSRRRQACMVRVSFPVTDRRRRDPHNQAPTVKAIVDGLVDAGVWPDDTDEFVIVLDPKFHKPTDDMRVVRVELIPRAGDLPT